MLEVPVDDYINYGLRTCVVTIIHIHIVHEFCAILLPCLVLEETVVYITGRI